MPKDIKTRPFSLNPSETPKKKETIKDVVDFLTKITPQTPVSATCHPRGPCSITTTSPYLTMTNQLMICVRLSLDNNAESLYLCPMVTQGNKTGVEATTYINNVLEFGLGQAPLKGGVEDPNDFISLETSLGYFTVSELIREAKLQTKRETPRFPKRRLSSNCTAVTPETFDRLKRIRDGMNLHLVQIRKDLPKSCEESSESESSSGSESSGTGSD